MFVAKKFGIAFFALCVFALARGDEGAFSIPGLGTVRPDEIVAPPVSPGSLERDLRLLEKTFASPPPAVSARDGVASYVGATNAAGFDALAALAKRENISVLEIDSLGGEVFWGMKIGGLVFANRWDVRVAGHCFSSCANYIFPAGAGKVVAADSVVGWHGSARQVEALAARAGVSLEERFAGELVPAMMEGFSRSGQGELTREMLIAGLAGELGRHHARREMEADFFRRIGVDADSAIYGFLPESGLPENAGGWTFRIPDMAKFGIGNVKWLGEGEYPPPEKLALLGLSLLAVE